jgi:hypothetical protein
VFRFLNEEQAVYFNLGNLSPNTWIGEEILINQTSLPYSVMAETPIKVLQISLENMQSLFPREFTENLLNV